MRIRTKIFAGYILAAAVAIYFIQDWMKSDLRVRYLEAVEENMVDMANTLAEFASTTVAVSRDGTLNPSEFVEVFQSLRSRNPNAKIYELTKRSVDTNVYITDARGVVVFDSGHPENVGVDFARWRDVRLTLKGKYGARATRTKKDDPKTLVMYIAAPIIRDGRLVGVLTLYKPIAFLTRFISLAEERTVGNAVLGFAVLVALGFAVSFWVSAPVVRLKKSVESIRDGGGALERRFGGGEIGELAVAFEEMRMTLEGKKYVEEYVAALAHELKSPISAIRGVLELIGESGFPEKRRGQFIDNALRESERMRKLVDRMLLLAKLENAKFPLEVSEMDLKKLLDASLESVASAFPNRKILFNPEAEGDVLIEGDPTLLRELFDNILRNAAEFTKQEGVIRVDVMRREKSVEVVVLDDGEGIPGFAKGKVFDKFYSLPRPDGGKKSSGLGLSLAKEIVLKHNGNITLDSRQGEGTTVRISLPTVD